MRPPTVHRGPRPCKALASLATIMLAVGACGGSSPAAPTAGAVVTAAPPTPIAVASAVPTSTAAPSPSPSSLAALALLWQKGGPTRNKTETYWPTVNPVTGNVWVASSFDDQYWIFSPDGKFLEAWGTPGTGPGQFKLTTNDPNPDGVGAIAFGPDGTFYVADNGNHRVEKFDKDRHFVTMWGSFGTGDGQFASPKGIATDGKTIYVADDPRGDVQAFDTNGRFLRSFPFPFVLFTLARSGHLFVADRSGVLELDGTGRQVAHFDFDFAGMGGDPAQSAVDDAGHIYLNIQNQTGPIGLVELDAQGAILHRWSTGGETMAVARDGKAVYLAFTALSNQGWDFIRKYALP
jgi:NHL repeat